MDVDGRERRLLHEVQAHHHHPGDPEEDDVPARDEHVGRVIALHFARVVGPAERRERPQPRGKPGVEHVLIARDEAFALGRILRHLAPLRFRDDFLLDVVAERVADGFFFGLGDEHLAVGPVPCRDLMTPPELARDAPGLDVLHPLEIGLFPVLRHELGRTRAHGRDRRLRHGLGVDIPLVGQIGLKDHAGTVAMRHHMRIRLDLFQEAEILQPGHELLARSEAFDVVQLFGQLLRTFRQAAQIILVAHEVHAAFLIKHVDPRQAMPLADLEVVEVVRRRDLDRARSLLGIGVVVADDRDAAADQRQNHMLADQMADPFVLRMHGNGGVAEHRLGPRRRHDDERRRIVGAERLALDRIAQVPEIALDLDLLHFEVGDRGEQFRIPVHQPLVFVDQPFAVQFDEHLHDRARQALVHGEAFARPVAGSAEALQLVDDGVAALRLPLPDAFEEFGAAHVAAARLLPFHQLPFDHHLGRDAGVIGAGLPQHVAAAHALEAAENVLQRVVERVAHMQRARHVRRRDHDGERRGVFPFRAAGLERAALLPDPGHAAFDIGGLVVFLDHGTAIWGCGAALENPPRPRQENVVKTTGSARIMDLAAPEGCNSAASQPDPMAARLQWPWNGSSRPERPRGRPRETRSISALTIRSTNPGRLSSSQDFSIGRSISLTRSSSVRALLLSTVLASELKADSTAETVECDKICSCWRGALERGGS